jgi:hypothetical protein
MVALPVAFIGIYGAPAVLPEQPYVEQVMTQAF